MRVVLEALDRRLRRLEAGGRGREQRRRLLPRCARKQLKLVSFNYSHLNGEQRERDKKGSRWPVTQSGRRGPVWTCPSGIQAPSAASPGHAGVDPGGWPGRVQAHPQAAVTLVPSTPGCPVALPPTVREWKGSKLPQSWNYWDFTGSDELSVEPSGLGGILWVGSCQLSLFLKWRETTCADLALLSLVLVNWFS